MASMEEGITEETQSKLNKYACACAVIGSMISIIFGYDTGVMSGAMIFIKEDLKITETQVEVLAGILNLCALVGSIAAGRITDYIGRRYTIVVASIIFLFGAVLSGYAPTYAVLMTGRCTAGVGVGFALMIAPVYSAEISSPSSRGLLSSLPSLCISIGILLGYISNYVFSKLPLKLGWRMMLGVAAIPSLLLAGGILSMPESPRWLVMQGRLGAAKKVLIRVSNTKEEAEARFRDIKVAAAIDDNCNDEIVVVPPQTRGGGAWKELLLRPSPAVRRILLAAVGINFFQHATGIEAVVLYGPRIFKKAGVISKSKLLLATVGVGVTKTVFIVVAAFMLDRFGRRRLLLSSTGGMIVALACLALGLTVVEHSKAHLLWALSLCIVSTYMFVAFFSIGLGPTTWVYTSEIFPLKLRAQGVGIAVGVNRVMNAVVSMSFISIYEAITIGGSFFIFCGICALAWLFFFFFLPETRGRTLEEMEMVFSKGINSNNVGLEIQSGYNNEQSLEKN